MKFQHWLIIIPLAHGTDAIYSNRKENHTHTYIYILCVVQFLTYAAGGSGSEPELALMILSGFFGFEKLCFLQSCVIFRLMVTVQVGNLMKCNWEVVPQHLFTSSTIFAA